VLAVETAISTGYRLIDTPHRISTSVKWERRSKQRASKRDALRADQDVDQRLWYESGLHAFDVSVRKLGLEYVDLYLLHNDAKEWDARWRRVRAIGVSNFSVKHLDDSSRALT